MGPPGHHRADPRPDSRAAQGDRGTTDTHSGRGAEVVVGVGRRTGEASQPTRRKGRPPGSGPTKHAAGTPPRAAKKRTMSAEARAKISAAQKARWAKQKGRKG